LPPPMTTWGNAFLNINLISYSRGKKKEKRKGRECKRGKLSAAKNRVIPRVASSFASPGLAEKKKKEERRNGISG